MRFAVIFPLVFVFSALCAGASFADTATDANPFQSGVAATKKNDLGAARTSFRSALAQDPDNLTTLYNLGFVEYRTGNLGLALALWRKALATDPEFTPARRAVGYTKGKLEHGEIAHEVEFSEQFRNAALAPIALDKFLLVSAVFLAVAGWLLLRYVGQRRRALLDERPLPPPPIVGALAGLLFLSAIALSVAKAIDQDELRATILAKKVEARSTPEMTGTSLFDLYEGLEVVVRQAKGDWIQVTYPGGATGWIPRNTIFTTRDKVAP